MNISARSVIMAGVATVTASAVVIAPSVQPPPPPGPTIQLAAAVQPLAQPPAPTTLAGWVQRILIPPSFGTSPPSLPPPIAVPTPGSIGSSITNIYIAIEPWVHYGFEVAQYAVGWIPFVGWLAPQIDIFYHLGERIVRSIVFNIADWLDRKISFGQGLVNVGVDTINSFIFFANDQIDFWLPSLPPLPPLPPICFRCNTLATTTLVDPTAAPGVGVENAGVLGGLLDRVINPLNAGGGVDGVFSGVGSLGSHFRNGFAGIGDILDVPLSPPDQEKTSEVSTVPSIVKTPFAPLKSLPLAGVTKTVGNMRNEIRTNFNATNRQTLETGTIGVVRAQGQVRGTVGKAANDFAKVLHVGRPGKTAEDGATASTNVSKSFGDTARKVVKEVRQAARDRAADHD